MKTPTAKQAERTLKKFSSKIKAEKAKRFFKTGKGQYSENDQFLGVTTPEIRKTQKQFQNLKTSEVAKLLKSKWHEVRALGFSILVNQYQMAEQQEQKKLFQIYIKHKKFVNNWDLVDGTAPRLSGHYFFHKKDKSTILKLAKSKNLWDRRIAVVSTFYHIRQERYSEILQLSKMLLKDEEDLMHKACGWMLREVGKRDRATLIRFLHQYAPQMPRTMLRYAIEKFNPEERTRFLGL